MTAYRSRYVDITVDEADQDELDLTLVYARLPSGELVSIDRDVFDKAYVPVLTTSVDLSEGLG